MLYYFLRLDIEKNCEFRIISLPMCSLCMCFSFCCKVLLRMQFGALGGLGRGVGVKHRIVQHCGALAHLVTWKRSRLAGSSCKWHIFWSCANLLEQVLRYVGCFNGCPVERSSQFDVPSLDPPLTNSVAACRSSKMFSARPLVFASEHATAAGA